jgi:membrane protease YdiL (CAAX protease family)
MQKSKLVQLAIGGSIGLVLGGLLAAKDEIGFWLYGLPIALVMVLNGPLTGKRFITGVRERLAQDPRALSSIYWQLITPAWMLAAGAVLFMWAYGIEPPDYGFEPSIGEPSVLSYVLAVACLTTSLTLALRRNHRNEPLQDSVEILLPNTPSEKWVWSFLSFTAGVCEEIAYRGFLTIYFYYLHPSVPLWLALVASTIAFGLAHTYQGVRGVATTTILGAVLAYLYWDTESLLLPIVVHIAVDLIVLLRRTDEQTTAGDPEHQN